MDVALCSRNNDNLDMGQSLPPDPDWSSLLRLNIIYLAEVPS